MTKNTYYFHLQSLRGICCLIIVLFHIQALSTSFLTQNIFVRNGELAVDFFFVLSGFVISHNYSQLIKKTNDLYLFIKKRFFRLYPLHFLCLVLYLFIEIAKFVVEKYYGIKANEIAFVTNNIKTFLTNLALLHGIVDKELSYNEVSWSISFEFYTYFIFGIALLLLKKNKIFNIFSFFVILLSLYLVYKYSLMKEVNQLAFFRCTYSFFIGSITFLLSNKIKIKLDYIQIPFLLLIILFWSMPNKEVMPILFGFLIIILNNSDEGHLNKILKNKLLIFLGKISYSIYMLHYFVIWNLIQICRFILKIPTQKNNNSTVIVLDESSSLLFIICVVFITIFIANYSYEKIEKKFKYKA